MAVQVSSLRPICRVTNLTNTTVRLFDTFTLRPFVRGVNLFEKIYTLTEDQVIKALHIPSGELYILRDVKGIISIDEIVLAGTATNSFYSMVTVSGNASLATNVNVVLVDATESNLTVTLPNAIDNSGYYVTIKKIDATGNTVTVLTRSNQTIDGASFKLMPSQWIAITLVSDGANWFII